MDLGESLTAGDGISLEDAASLLWAKADEGKTTSLPKLEFEAMLAKSEKLSQAVLRRGHIVDAASDVVHATHQGEHGLDLGEGLEDEGVFRYTNGAYGGSGGKKKWLKCEGKCKGTGFGGYGWCYTKGENKPWGGCMAPGADPAILQPPKLYSKNHIATAKVPRAHLFCKNGEELWIRRGPTLVPACGECKSSDYFLVPNQHIKNQMVGSCFSIARYRTWMKALVAAKSGLSSPLTCSVFTNGKGMTSQYFGNQPKDKFFYAPKKSPYNPRAFICTTTSSVSDHTVSGDLQHGYREMRVFATSVARFVMCHTASPDATHLECVKKKRLGSCKSYFMRNAAFDANAVHIPSPSSNSTGLDWNQAARDWDKKALIIGVHKLMKGAKSGALGFNDCNQDWNERILAVH